MAKFSQNTINQVAGFNNQILAQELVYNQKDFWNFAWNSTQSYQSGWQVNTTPMDLTGATISAQIIRRAITNYHDSRTGIDFQIHDYPLVPLLTLATELNGSTITVATTVDLYPGQYIQILGYSEQLGEYIPDTVYTVQTITSPTQFTIDGSFDPSLTGTFKVNKATPSPINLPISNRNDVAGTFTMTINDETWDIIAQDPELDINATEPICFTGHVKIGFPAVGSQPAYDEFVFLLFTVNSDGVVN